MTIMPLSRRILDTFMGLVPDSRVTARAATHSFPRFQNGGTTPEKSLLQLFAPNGNGMLAVVTAQPFVQETPLARFHTNALSREQVAALNNAIAGAAATKAATQLSVLATQLEQKRRPVRLWLNSLVSRVSGGVIPTRWFRLPINPEDLSPLLPADDHKLLGALPGLCRAIPVVSVRAYARPGEKLKRDGLGLNT